MNHVVAPIAFVLSGVISLLGVPPAHALDGDGEAPDEETADQIRRALCQHDTAADACGACSETDETPTISRIYTGQFRPDGPTELVAAVDGCDEGAGLALLEEGDRGWRLDAWQSMPVSVEACRHFRPPIPDRARDVLVCSMPTKLGELDAIRRMFLSVRVGGDGFKLRQLEASDDERVGCPTGTFEASRPVKWRSWTSEEGNRPPRIALLLETVKTSVPEDADDLCDATENHGFDPWEQAHRRTVVFDLEARHKSEDWPFRTEFKERHAGFRHSDVQKAVDDGNLDAAVDALTRQELDSDGRVPDENTTKQIAESVCAGEETKSLCAECPEGAESLQIQRIFEASFLPDSGSTTLAVVQGCSTESTALVHLQSTDDGYRAGHLKSNLSVDACSHLRARKPNDAPDVLVCHSSTQNDGTITGKLQAVRVGDDGLVARELVEYHNNLAGCPARQATAVRPKAWRSWRRAGTDGHPRIAVVFGAFERVELPDGADTVCEARRFQGFSPWQLAPFRTVIFDLEPVEADENWQFKTRLREGEPAYSQTQVAGVEKIESIVPPRQKGPIIGTIGRRPGRKDRQNSEDSDTSPTAELSLETPNVQGPLDADLVGRVVRQHRREWKYCYEQQLEDDPELSGRVSVQFSISPDGKVTSASVPRSTLEAPDVEQCIANKTRRWVFPAPEDGGAVEVNQSIEFGTRQ